MLTQKLREIGKTTDAAPLSTEVQRLRRRLDPHAQSGFEASPGRHDLSALNPEKQKVAAAQREAAAADQPTSRELRFPDGTLVTIPGLSQATHLEIAKTLARVSPERRAAVEAAAVNVAKVLYLEVGKTPDAASRPVTAAVSGAYRQNQEAYTLGAGAEDHNANQRGAYTTAIWAVERELHGYFEEAQERISQTQDARTDYAELVGMLADWPDDGSTQPFTYRDVVIHDDGTTTVTEKTVELTKERALALATQLQAQIDNMSEFSAGDSFRLQKMAQDYQQCLTILTNILKQQDESLRGIAGNVRA